MVKHGQPRGIVLRGPLGARLADRRLVVSVRKPVGSALLASLGAPRTLKRLRGVQEVDDGVVLSSCFRVSKKWPGSKKRKCKTERPGGRRWPGKRCFRRVLSPCCRPQTARTSPGSSGRPENTKKRRLKIKDIVRVTGRLSHLHGAFGRSHLSSGTHKHPIRLNHRRRWRWARVFEGRFRWFLRFYRILSRGGRAKTACRSRLDTKKVSTELEST